MLFEIIQGDSDSQLWSHFADIKASNEYMKRLAEKSDCFFHWAFHISEAFFMKSDFLNLKIRAASRYQSIRSQFAYTFSTFFFNSFKLFNKLKCCFGDWCPSGFQMENMEKARRSRVFEYSKNQLIPLEKFWTFEDLFGNKNHRIWSEFASF